MAWQDRAYNRDEQASGGGFSFLVPKSKLVFVLIAVNLIVFIAQAATGRSQATMPAMSSPLVEWGALTFVDALAFTQPWRWITYQYLHGGGVHLFFNLITMFFFLPFLEQRWGWRNTLIFYTAGGIAGGATYGILCAIIGWHGDLIGASGSLLAVIGAIATIAPNMQVLLLVIPLTMRVLATLYAILYMLTIIGDRDRSDAAHLGGLLFGVGAVYLGGPVWRRMTQKMARNRTRRLVQADRDEQQMVDRILQKVHDHGMHSLTWRERRALRKATDHQRERDRELSRRI